MSVYSLAVQCERPNTRARCSGSARAVRASWSTRSRRMRSTLTPCHCQPARRGTRQHEPGQHAGLEAGQFLARRHPMLTQVTHQRHSHPPPDFTRDDRSSAWARSFHGD